MRSLQIDRLFQLLRYHKPSQLMWRGRGIVQQRWQRRFPRVYQPSTGPVAFTGQSGLLLKKLHRRRLGLWPLRQTPESLAGMAKGKFTFLNEPHSLSLGVDRSSPAKPGDAFDNRLDWQPNAPRLWRFHLQYHESILELADEVGGDAAWQMIESWLDFPSNQTPYLDADAWHPFCLSVRLPNWLMLAATEEVPSEIDKRFWQSVSEQVNWLWQNPEWDLGGNHLLENLRTLAIADATLTGDICIDRGKLYRWIDQEIESQLLASGEHYERTPTYHALMLLAMIEIADSAEAIGVPCNASSAATKMASFLESILLPDDQIPLFGDSVFTETPTPRTLINDALEPSEPSKTPSHSDYWVHQSEDGQSQLIVDLGNTACDHLPAHAHADLLTFEAAAFGKRFLVDTGTFDYEESSERIHCRSTHSHNTLRIDEQNHCDVWSRFRMGRRGHVNTRIAGSSDTHAWCLAKHDAYRFLGIANSCRLIVADRRRGNGFAWLVADWFESDESHQLSSPLHIGPEFKLDQTDPELACLRLASDESQSIYLRSSTPIHLSKNEYFPDFGVRVPIDRLEQSSVSKGQQPIVWYLSTTAHEPLPKVKVSVQDCTVHWCDDSSGSLIIPNCQIT